MFLQKDSEHTKTQINLNQSTKAKPSEKKNNKSNSFLRAHKLLREWLGFGAFACWKSSGKKKKKKKKDLKYQKKPEIYS